MSRDGGDAAMWAGEEAAKCLEFSRNSHTCWRTENGRGGGNSRTVNYARTRALTDVCEAAELGSPKKGTSICKSRRKCSSWRGNQKSGDDGGDASSDGSSHSD